VQGAVPRCLKPEHRPVVTYKQICLQIHFKNHGNIRHPTKRNLRAADEAVLNKVLKKIENPPEYFYM
jgi:hypothetical protein